MSALFLARRTAFAGLSLFLVATGCSIDPFCLDCVEADGGEAMDAAFDSAIPRLDARPEDSRVEDSAAALDACGPVTERCDELDNDCDGEIDEDFDLQTDRNHCGDCATRCQPPNGLGICQAGSCTFTDCAPQFYDLDRQPDNGCEYECARTDPDDVRCDLVDNDCDGSVDEDIDLQIDPENCGACQQRCGRLANATASCVAGACTLGACDSGFADADSNPANGCECLLATPAIESCNLRDDDCDGHVDEGNPGGGDACGSGTGECSVGIETCIDGAVVCDGEIQPTGELCNGLDDDCDGASDEANPEGGRLCGTGIGSCELGREVCAAGALVCAGGIGPSEESCNGLDDDCDGRIDEGDPEGGGTCASDTGACAFGVQHCRGGVLACEGATGPTIETCNASDDDCDGTTDEGNPGGGAICGSSVGACSTGIRACLAGALVCTGETGPSTEICDAIDNDCDGRIDEGNPGGGSSCGDDTGECSAGSLTCTNGRFACTGNIGPSSERCDALDNDCDGSVDEGNPDGGANCGTNTGACSTGTQTCSGGLLVCTGATNASVESCNSIDDDCDGRTDEGNPEGGAQCGAAIGQCTSGLRVCSGGTLICQGGTGPGAELCDGLDNDCDGSTDEGNPGGGASCGVDIGTCSPGTRQCISGALACVGLVGPSAESCDGLDNDCDTRVDEGNPQGGAACGIDTGECAAGARQCVGGTLTCAGEIGPVAEVCDGRDNDCDGSIDENNPGGGGSCGTDIGTCETGTRVCTSGALICQGTVDAVPESCDGLDNDCDTRVDEGNPGGGGACGDSTGLCELGTRVCTAGTLVCSGATGPSLEICNDQDDDCDGSSDEGFNLSADVANCGACGNSCVSTNAIPTCSAGSCAVLACLPGNVDLNGNAVDGCEYACDFIGAEVCNGRDDDCDGLTDEGLTPPTTLCSRNGVCATGTTISCDGSSGWACNYPPLTYQQTETRCDGLDNDCDGLIDEPYPLVGTSCNNAGIGACRRVGSFVCNGTADGVQCNAAPNPGGTPEICDGIDNDCDGVLDDGAPASWVQFTSGGSTRWIMQYEASRPDSSAGSTGTMSHRVCSEVNRRPWTQVTYSQAQAACATIGARLCTETEWRNACRSQSGSCRWSYASSCTTYAPDTCNGNDTDAIPGGADDDIVLPTGSFAACYSNWGSVSQRVFDLSGNVEEWAERRAAGVNPIRGGSTNDTAGGMECDFDFVVAGETYNTETVGFRCCRSTAP